MVSKEAGKVTSDLVLDAAEELFAERGFHGSTVRLLTKMAGVNLAAVNYHYRDKRSLYLAVLERRLRPINRRRLSGLQEATERAGDCIIPLYDIVEIMAGPVFELASDQTHSGRWAPRLLGRSLTEPLPFAENFLRSEMEPVLARFAQALRRHFPAYSPEKFLWRFSFVVGALHHAVATMHDMNRRTRGICRDNDHETALHNFILFAIGGLTDPPPASPRN